MEKKHLTDYPEIMLDWNQENHPDIDPITITAGSHRSILWKCHKCGREWSATVRNRVNGTGCTCDAKERQVKKLREYLLRRDGSLMRTRPEIAAQWHPTLNGTLTPNDLTAKSMYKAWWIGNDGIAWQSVVAVRCRAAEGTKRPKELVIKGYNDLKTLHPDLALEWNYARNQNVNIECVMPGSKLKVWWICVKGHEWEATVASRNAGRGCPICNQERNTSFPEQAMFYYIKKVFPDAENRFYLEPRLEIDVYIPSKKIAFEYDGRYYHQSERKRAIDEKKNQRLKELGITLIRLVEEGEDCFSGFPYTIRCDRVHNVALVDSALNKLFELLSVLLAQTIHVDFNSERDRPKILEQYVFSEKENSLVSIAPEIVTEWHPTKNGRLNPEYIRAMSNKPLWWKCIKCGYEWKAPAYRRAKGMGCPACSGNTVAVGINDLPTVRPDLMEEWNYERNTGVDPSRFLAGSNKKVWWKCHKCAYEWQAAIANRARGTNCPKCSGKIVCETNSFAALFPDLAKQWANDLNGDFSPQNFLPGSDKKVWWRCEKGHIWKSSIHGRTKKNNCPYCGNKKVLTGFNDFATLHPELLSEWDDEVEPQSVLAGSNKTIKWVCGKGHRWSARISNRIKGSGCPYCAGKQIDKGKNDLEANYPQLAKEWNADRNGGMLPSDVTPGSNRKVWWKCPKCGNEWEAVIWSRVKGRGCPRCRGKK